MSQPAAPAPQQPYPPRPSKPRPSSRLVLSIAAFAVVGLAVMFVVISNNANQVGGKPASSTSNTPPTTEDTAVGIDAPVVGYVPAPTDFVLEVVVLEEKCFGSAGCNVTFTIDVKYLGARPPDPKREFTAIYDVTGGSEPLTNRFTINGDQVSIQSEELIQTDSPDSTLVATVTRML